MRFLMAASAFLLAFVLAACGGGSGPSLPGSSEGITVPETFTRRVPPSDQGRRDGGDVGRFDVGSKAAWFEITDDLPQFHEYAK